MAGSFAKLVVSLGANISSFETDMKRASALSKQELGKMERQAKQLNDTWNRNFKLAAGAVVAGLVLATKAAAEFGNSMAEVSTLLDDTSGMDRLSDSVRDLSVQFGQAPTTQAKALYQIISAGASDSRSQMEQLTAANKLAVGGVTDVATAADGLTTVLNAYAGTGLEVTRISDIMFSTMRGGKTTIGEMSASIGVVASTAAQVGVSFEELGAAIATVTKSTGSTERTMTGLRAVFNAVLAQTEQTKKAAEELGISFDIAGRGANGFQELLAEIAASNATDEQLKRLLGSTEALSAFLPLLSQNAKEFGVQLESASNSAGAADKAFAKMADTAKFRADQAAAAFKSLQIELGQRFLSSVSNTAVAFVKHIDDIVRAVEVMVTFIAGRATIAVVASFATMAAAGKTAAAVMAILGGSVGAAGAALGSIAAIVYNNISQTDRMNFALAAMTQTLEGATAEWLKNADAVERGIVIEKVVQAQQDAAERIAVIAERMAQLKKNFGAATDQLEFSGEFQSLVAELDSLTQGIEEADVVLGEINKSFIEGNVAIGGFVDGVLAVSPPVKKLAGAFDEANKRLKEIKKTVSEANVILSITQERANRTGKSFKEMSEASDRAADTIGKFIEELEEADKEAEEFAQSLEGVLDALYPIQAEGRRLGDTLAILTRAVESGALSWEQYEEAVRLATEGFDKAVKGIRDTVEEVDMLKVAMDEGARIMERIFQDLFTGIIDDSSKAWDAILDGFQSMIGRMSSEAARGIQLEFQTAFAEGGGGLSAVDWKSVGLNFGQIAAAAFSDDVVRALFGGDDFGVDYVEIGKQIGTVAGSIIGSFIPVIGTALGGIIGSFAGALGGMLFGEAFGRKFGAILGGTVAAEIHGAARDAQVLRTPLANVVGISGQGGFGDLNDPETPGGKIGIAIRTFDQAIFDILKTLDASEEFEEIVTALETWKGAIDGGANDLEALLKHRFNTILGTFEPFVKDFVQLGDTIEEQIERFGSALQVDKLFELFPEQLAGRTQAEFLAIIEKYAEGMKTIGEATQEVTQAFIQVAGLLKFLGEFSDSDLLGEFTSYLDAQGRTITQKLTAVVSALFDAVAGFDGSIESIQEIAGLVAAVREGEMQLLLQIDAIQKGINSNLDQLKADILGVTETDKTGEQLFNQAQDLIGRITDASTVEDVAGIEREFDAIVRSIAPEDQALMQNELLAVIELFRARADEVLNARRNEALESANDTRALIDELIIRVGDPLDVIAAAVEGRNLPEVMEDGLSQINATVATIGPQVSNAITQGLSGVQFNIINQTSGGLVTQ